MNGTLIGLRPREHLSYVSRGRSVLITGRDGLVTDPAEQGFFVHQTRLLSRLVYLVNGAPPLPCGLSSVEPHAWMGYYLAESPRRADRVEGFTPGPAGPIAQESIELNVTRVVADGLHEDLRVTNHTRYPVRLTLSVDLESDFADSSKPLEPPPGTLTKRWKRFSPSEAEWRLSFEAAASYHEDGESGEVRLRRDATLRVRCERGLSADGPPLRFDLDLSPGGVWQACLALEPEFEDRKTVPFTACPGSGGGHAYDRKTSVFIDRAARFSSAGSGTLTPLVLETLDRAKRDLAALRLYDLGEHGDGWTMAAGLPVYLSLFGRDTLTASWQSAMLGPEMMRGSLTELPLWQGTRDVPWRDEEPGKMLHDAYTGIQPLTNRNPHGRYYGSITTSGFYPVALTELWHWTGDRSLVRPFIDPALKALRWLDERGDLDGDGFYEYRTRSRMGVRNQGWKDSDDALVHEDGSQARAPIATCEEQAFIYLAKLHLSEMLRWFGDDGLAARFFREAEELKKRFDGAFWLEDEGFYAMGLDRDKRPIRSIGSNAGHCLAAGIAESSRARLVTQRLFAEDLFSGWGVRTLSSAHPAYNPFSYHRGSVWPVEQGTFALGCLRYGMTHHLQSLCRAVFEAASLFENRRLPELFSGHPRDAAHPFPAMYPAACSPQAWSASTVFSLLQSLLGLYPYAPLDLLIVDPRLPDWLPEITLEGLRVGRATADLRFFRGVDGASDFRVLDCRGPLHVVRQPSPWSLTAGAGERVRDLVSGLRIKK
ncbi:MAG TPA: glycogen debranching N-terminal domain-containing protein [Candidatus Eisenbacteria bacterium]|jgi:glycogen debranching enzyme|nr:glycogen debranching N-terminal domain-containing protein [Candidatus Eisenbacteria bacterium]